MSEEYLKIIQKGVKETLAKYQKKSLVLPYLLFAGPTKTAAMTKEALQKRLFALFPARSLLAHVDYITHVSPVQRAAVDLYQSSAFQTINSYLRYGAIRQPAVYSYEDQLEYVNAATFKNATSKYVAEQLKQIKKKSKEAITRKKTLYDKTRAAVKTLLSVIQKAPRVNTPFYVYRGERDFELKWSKSDDPYENMDDAYMLNQLALKVGDTYDMKSFGSYSAAPWVAANFSGGSPCCLFRLKIDSAVPCLIFLYSEQYTEFEILLPPAAYKVTQITFLESPLSPELKVKLYDVEFVKALKPKLG